jgi:hypothetical protein
MYQPTSWAEGLLRLETTARPEAFGPFAPRHGEIKLVKEVLDHRLIDLRARTLVRANEV